jgi:hypothetical protein
MLDKHPILHPLTVIINGYSFVVGLTIVLLPADLQAGLFMMLACWIAVFLNLLAAYNERSFLFVCRSMLMLSGFWAINAALQTLRVCGLLP